MFISRFAIAAMAVVIVWSGSYKANGQEYPNKTIRVVAPGAGGASDIVARFIAQGIAPTLGQAVIVENRGGILPGQTVAQAAPDGYTLLFQGSIFWIGSVLQKTPYDPIKDFAPITLATRMPNVVLVHPSLPVRSVKELIAFAKARPGQLNYSSGGTGGSSHLAAESFKSMAGVDIVRIPDSTNSGELQLVLRGEAPVWFPTMGSAAPHIKSGRLRALAVASAEPSSLMPSLPTVAASGLPGYESVQTTGMFAPARTSAAIVIRLNQEIVRYLKAPDTKEKFFNAGLEIVGSSPDELAATMKSDVAKTAKLIKDLGIKPE